MHFGHGVASGDPLTDRVILWTRVTPGPHDGAAAATPVSAAALPATGGSYAIGPVAVGWEVATDPDFEGVVARGEAEATPDHDYTVKVDATGLRPGTNYHYRFSAGAGSFSPTGTTLTAPEGPTESLRIGLVSCSSWSNGYFNAYRNLAERDIDLVMHVGDYIYEGTHRAGRAVRSVPRPDPATRLDHYRRRYALYHRDPDLLALHARHPMVAVWDDHEISSGAWRDGASGHHPRRHGPWADRRAAAVSAYLEWVPLRVPSKPGGTGGSDEPSEPDRIYRSLRWGDLADLFMLDTRLVGRDRPAGDGRIVWSPGRTRRNLLGDRQRRWLEGEVSRSDGRWRLLGNQVMMAPAAVLAGHIVNPDQWDGYPTEREWLYRLMGGGSSPGNDVVVLSGDLHSSWASELPIGAEFLTPGVTARTFSSSLLWSERWAPMAEMIFRWQNRHVKMVDLRHHGYVVVDVNRDRVQADFWHLHTLRKPSTTETWAGGWQLRHGVPGLIPAHTPVRPRVAAAR